MKKRKRKIIGVQAIDCTDIISHNLRIERLRHGWSQQFVADHAGLSLKSVWRAENYVHVTRYGLDRLCNLYDISLLSVVQTAISNDAPQTKDFIPPQRLANMLGSSDFLRSVQHECVMHYIDHAKETSHLSRKQILAILYEMLGKQDSYSRDDFVKAARAINIYTVLLMENAAVI